MWIAILYSQWHLPISLSLPSFYHTFHSYVSLEKNKTFLFLVSGLDIFIRSFSTFSLFLSVENENQKLNMFVYVVFHLLYEVEEFGRTQWDWGRNRNCFFLHFFFFVFFFLHIITLFNVRDRSTCLLLHFDSEHFYYPQTDNNNNKKQ